jgi:hypothetical protein
VLSIEKITKALSGSSLLKKTWKELASEYLKSKDIL